MTLPVTTVTVTQASLSGAVGSVITVTVTATGSRRRPPESRHVARAGGHCDRHGAGRGWQPTAHGHGHGGTVALIMMIT